MADLQTRARSAQEITADIRRLQPRSFDWVMTAIMFSIGMHLLCFPQSAYVSNFRVALEQFGVWTVAAAFIVLSLSRAFGLSRWCGPYGGWCYGLCAAGSAASALVWAQLCLTLYHVPASGPPSPFVWTYFCLTCGEVYATYRAWRDGWGV